MKKFILQLLAIIIFGLVIGYLSGRWVRRHIQPEVIEIVHTDTLVIRDTVRIARPVYISQRIVDTLLVPVTDTLRLHDTTYVSLPRIQREYADSTYRVWVSGYEPALDSIDVYSKTEYITTTIREKPKRWHIGITGGYGVGTKGLTPYAGVGLTYSIISF